MVLTDVESVPSEQVLARPGEQRNFLGRLAVGVLLLVQIVACIVGAGPALAGKIDLRSFYAAGTIVRTGHAASLYEYDYENKVQNEVVSRRDAALPFLYPPFAALPFVPLSLLSYRVAFFALLMINGVLLFLAARVLQPCLGAHALSSVKLTALFACLFCVAITFMQGQVSIALVLLFSSCLRLLFSGRKFFAGVVLSLALIKFQLALPIVMLFLLWRQWPVIKGFVTGAMGLGILSLAIVGSQACLSYVRGITAVAAATSSNPLAAKARFGMFPTDMPNLHGLTFVLSHGAHWGQLLNLVLSGLVLVYASRQKESLPLAMMAAMLVSYHMQPHDLSLLVIPLSLLWSDRKNNLSTGIGWADAPLILAALTLTLPAGSWLMLRGGNGFIAITIASLMVALARAGSVEREQATPDHCVA